MRRSERHRIKENAFATAIAGLGRQAQDRSRTLGVIVAVVLGSSLVYGGYGWWSDRAESRAGVLLSDALILADAPVVPPPQTSTTDTREQGSEESSELETLPGGGEFSQPPGSYPSVEERLSAALPRLMEAADAYPASQAGITARYRAAAALAGLGRHAEAADQYQQVIELDELGVHGRMAILGLAAAQLSQGDYDNAIALLEQSVTSTTETDLPIDGVLMQLGRAYRSAGRTGDARTTYQRVVEEFPSSLYSPNAERELQALGIEG